MNHLSLCLLLLGQTPNPETPAPAGEVKAPAQVQPQRALEPTATEQAGGPVVKVETPDSEAHAIGLLLRCPVCQGMPISESPSTTAQNMMTRVRELLAEGKSREEILEYFRKSYGEWALLNPEPEGLNWFVWILPPIALVLGVLLLGFYLKSSQSEQDGTATPATKDGQKRAPEPDQNKNEDAYLEAIREEVRS